MTPVILSPQKIGELTEKNFVSPRMAQRVFSSHEELRKRLLVAERELDRAISLVRAYEEAHGSCSL